MRTVQKVNDQKRHTDRKIKYGRRPSAVPKELVPTSAESQVLLDQGCPLFAYADGSCQCCQPAGVQALETLCKHNIETLGLPCQVNTQDGFMKSSKLTMQLEDGPVGQQYVENWH